MPNDPWLRLVEPFAPEVVKERQGPRQHAGDCVKEYGRCTKQHKMLSYVDARDVSLRLDEVFRPQNWTFSCDVVPGVNVVHGRLTVREGGVETFREDHGYPNSEDDDEPIKSATSDCFKRCAVQFGIGRHLYTDNKPKARTAQPPVPTESPLPPDQDTDPSDPSWTIGQDEAFEQLVAGNSRILRPAPQRAPQSATEVPKCPIHKWDMRPDKRASHQGEYGCSGKMPDGSWCKERA
jgi:hypothetical protein